MNGIASNGSQQTEPSFNESDHAEFVTNVKEPKEEKQQDMQKESETVSKPETGKEQDYAGGVAAEENKAASEPEPVKPESPKPDLKVPKLTTLQDVVDLLKKYHEFLSKLDKYDNANTLFILKAISRFYWERKSWRTGVAQALIDSDILTILKKILMYGNSIGVFKSDSIWFPIYYTLSIIWNFTDSSAALVQKLIDMNFIKYYAANLTHEPYISNQSSKNVEYLMKSSLSTLQNCVRHVPNHSVYEEVNLVEALKPFMMSETVMLKALSVMTVSNLISDDENSKLEDTGAIPFMVKCMGKSLASVKGRFHGFSSLELAEALVRMAVNDGNKIKLVDAGVLPNLVTMMNTADESNQHMAAKVIWTLSFDDTVKDKIIQEPGCVDALKQLEHSKNSGVVKVAKGALWKISGEEEHQKQIEQTHIPQRADTDKHIFISYQHKNKDMVHSLNDRLKGDGYKVWIDIEQMGGSTLESMASAVENAKVVLVCASEGYKLSPSCRTEAEYTFQLKKPIVPLMMQRYYKPDGWLGMLMGAKMYINFDGKYEFDFAYQMLLKEMNPFLVARGDDGNDVTDGAAIVPVQQSLLGRAPPGRPRPVEREPSATRWNNDKVLEWMATNEIDQVGDKVKKLIEDMNGKLLVRFCKLKKEAPEFFYNQLRQEYELDMMSILVLTEAMDKLV